MSDTPRTDAVETNSKFPESGEYYLMTSFARELERELAEAKKDTERLDWLDKNMIGSFGTLQHSGNPHPIHTWSFEAPLHDNKEGELDLRASLDAAKKVSV